MKNEKKKERKNEKKKKWHGCLETRDDLLKEGRGPTGALMQKTLFVFSSFAPDPLSAGCARDRQTPVPVASGSEISQRRDPQITPNVLAHCRTSNFDGRRGEKRSLKLFGGEGRREGPGVSAEKRRSKEGVGTELGNCLCHVNSARCSLITFPLFLFFFSFFFF